MLSCRIVFAAVFCSICAAPGFAQVDVSTISGRVLDPSGALVAGAKVTVVNTATNFSSETLTNSDGIYSVPSLRPGPYRVEISAAGFKHWVREGLDLQSGTTLAIDATMEVGGVNETVEVQGGAPLLETQTSTQSNVLPGDYFASLPEYQRDPKTSLRLTPNANASGEAYAGFMTGFHIMGAKDTEVGNFEDGMYAVGKSGFTADTIQNSVEEIKVITDVPAAEYGHSSGGVLSVIKKSGTNEVHGDLSEYGRDGAMQHRKFFQLYRFGQPQPGQTQGFSELYQQPDASLSGPVYIPKIYNGRNKMFFFFGVERLIEKQGKQAFYSVPDASELAGNFTLGGVGLPLYDPRSTTQLPNGNWQRTPIPGNIVPKSAFDPVAVKWLSLNPWAPPNQAGTETTTGPSNNLLGTYTNLVTFENYTGRIDRQITTNYKVYGTFTYNSQYGHTPNPNITNTLFDASQNKTMDKQWTTSVGQTWVLTPHMISETRLGYYRYSHYVLSPDYMKDIGGLLGIPNLPPDTFPGGLPLSVGAPSRDVKENVSFREDVSMVRGTHSLKMGYDFLDLREDSTSVGSPSGTFSLTGTSGLLPNGTSMPNTGGPSLAGFLLGSVSSVTFSHPLIAWLPRDTIHSAYLQDDWRVSPRLTLNLGVRYSNESPLHTKYNQISQFDPGLPDTLVPGGAGQITHPTSGLNKRDWNNFQPRVGLAWHPWNKVVVRSGFAISTVDVGLLINQQEEYSIQTVESQPVGNPAPLFQLSQGPLPITYPGVRSNGTYPYQGANLSSRTASTVDPTLHNPYDMNWKASVQYQLAPSYLLEVGYAGSAGVGLIENPNLNTLPWGYLSKDPTALNTFLGASQNYRPFPNYGNITEQMNLSHMTYHSGTVKIEKRFSRGLTFQAFYVLAHDIDGSGVGNVDVASKLYKGNASWDRRQDFTGSMTYDIPIGKGRRLMNRGGVLNAIFGDYRLVWVYTLESGNPVTFMFANSPYQYYPTFMGIQNRPNVLQQPGLRSDWQDIGGDRFNPANENSLICCLSDFAYPGNFQMGNEGKDIMAAQRITAASMSASKEIPIKERLRFIFRFDFQNPFKWYNWNAPNVTVDSKNPQNFGKVSAEEDTVGIGGNPLMNITLALKW